MKVTFTGGGTGGHIFPALEVARVAALGGADVRYIGSLRGQEGDLCRKTGVAFTGLRGSEPLYSLKTARGWRALARLLFARYSAIRYLKEDRPDCIFSTGGYSAGPVVAAAKRLSIPFVIHEQNSVPGRSNLLWSRSAATFAYTFRTTADYVHGANTHRTGMPVRDALRQTAKGMRPKSSPPLVLVVGGSLGSTFLNERIPHAAKLLGSNVQWLHSAGKGNDSAVKKTVEGLGLSNYRVVPYLEADEMAQSYAQATLAVSRSGGTLAELALFGLPGVLIPLPTSAKDHQLLNAREFEAMGAATTVEQSLATAELLAESILPWLNNKDKLLVAEAALAEFDAPEAANRLWEFIQQAAKA